MGETILTGELSSEQIDEEKKRQENFIIVEMFCECWYESLATGSISYLRALREITDMVERNIIKNHISEALGWTLIGQYSIKCRGVLKDGPTNGIPSALVTLLRDAKSKLPNPVTDRKYGNSQFISMNEDVSIYTRHSARLKEYGIEISPSTLKKWFEGHPLKS